jgi:hypothetical protein
MCTLFALARHLVALVTEMDLHVVPVEPVSVTLREHAAAMKTLELILG